MEELRELGWQGVKSIAMINDSCVGNQPEQGFVVLSAEQAPCVPQHSSGSWLVSKEKVMGCQNGSSP